MRRQRRISQKIRWRWATALALSLSLFTGMLLSEAARAQIGQRQVRTVNPILAKYVTDLTSAAEHGKFASLEVNSKDTERAIHILASHQKNNPVVISESQTVRDMVMIGVATRIATDNIPEELKNSRLYKLKLDAIFHDAKTPAELLTTISAILSELGNTNSRSIVIVDPLQSLIGPSSAFDGAASSLLRDALQNSQVQCFGASTEAAFEQNVANNVDLASLFSKVEAEAAVTPADKTDTAAGENQDLGEEFVGDKVSPDLREMLSSANAPSRVKAILQVNDANNPTLRHKLAEYGITIDSQLPRLGALAVDMPTSAIQKLADSGAANYLTPDRRIAGLGHVEVTTGDDAMLAEQGNSLLDGSGIGVAVLDSGISRKAKTLFGALVFSRDFTGEGTTDDIYGHGTFVASMIAAKHGAYGGIAPAAKLLNFRVLDSKGTGSMSALLNALDAVMLYRDEYNIRVVNMSLGMPAIDSYKNDPVCRAVRRLVNAGIVVVTAAGNDGKDATYPKVYGRIHSPGNEPSAITVGAANTYGTNSRADDTVTTYSSRGPTRSYWTDASGVKHYDNLIKPDLVAPGNKIIGAASPDNTIVATNPDLCVYDCGGSANSGRGKMQLSGTSVSAPIVAGAVAVLLEANPRLTPNMIKMILMYTAQPLAGFNMLEQGSGELNVAGAVQLARLVRTDLTYWTPVGSPLLIGPPPNPQTTIAGETFRWSQGILFKYDWAGGSAIITRYQGVYALGVLISDGVVVRDGVIVSDARVLSTGVVVSDNIIISNGGTMSDGSVLISSGVLIGDGVLVGDGVIVGDGVVISDGVVVSDGLIRGTGIMTADGIMVADSAMAGDATAAMGRE